MKFIGGEQLKYKKAIKDGKVVDKGKDNLITVPSGTTISFGDMTENRGKYSIVMTVVKNFGKGDVTKRITLNLI
mgnify:FL=1|jgi:hypothetical protein